MESRNVAMFKVGVFAIIFDAKNRVLLCHRRDHDLWNLPGGGMEEGETPWDGVIREVKEEVGLDVEIVRLAGVYAKPEQNEIVFSFVCAVKEGKLTLTDEADQIEYFKFDQVPSNTPPKQIERIRDAMENGACVIKTQAGPSAITLLREGKLK